MALSKKSKTNSSQLKKSKALSTKLTPTKKSRKKKLSYKYFDEYKDLFTGKQTPVPKNFLDKLCIQIIEWANTDEKAFNTDSFWFKKGIYPQTAIQWRDRYKPLEDAYQAAKHRIGLRREEGSLTKKFDNNTFFKTAPHYLKVFKDIEVWRSENKQKADEKTQRNNITWLLDKSPDSKLVPKKEKDEKR